MFVKIIKIAGAMKKRFREFVYALHTLCTADDTFYASKGKELGEYEMPSKDKENMIRDARNIYSDLNTAIKEGYGKVATQ